MKMLWNKLQRRQDMMLVLWDHFHCRCDQMPVLSVQFPFTNHANVQFAIHELIQSVDPNATLQGFTRKHRYEAATFGAMGSPHTAESFQKGPVSYDDVPIAHGKRLSCIKEGLYLFQFNNKRYALLISCTEHPPQIELSFTGGDVNQVESFVAMIREGVNTGKAFRGAVLALSCDRWGQTRVDFENLPRIHRDQIILPEAILERIERQTLAFSRNASRLASAGRHLKRGVLLHGPPGTGKTFTAMYLASCMPDRTVFLLTGTSVGMIERACTMARMLAPSTIILEDVDLIALDRDAQDVCANAVLFELLNQMDGLNDDHDILFLLTTNKPETLEPALAARPGRIDQAIEVPLPDADCRRRLLKQYSDGLDLQCESLDALVNRIEGVSAAFIRELLRKAALYAAIEEPRDEPNDAAARLRVSDAHLHEAIEELLVAGGTFTRSLLGAGSPIQE